MMVSDTLMQLRMALATVCLLAFLFLGKPPATPPDAQTQLAFPFMYESEARQ